MVENNKKANSQGAEAEDAVAEMIGDVLAALGRLTLFLLVWAVRLPVVSVPVIGVAIVGFQVGPRPAIAVALLVALMLCAWWLLSPGTLRAATVDPVVERFRVWRRYRDWAGVCADCGLTRTHGDKIVAPKLQTVRLGDSADTLVVRMVRGQTAADFGKAADALAGAFDAEQVRIEPTSPQQLRLIVQRSQPLAAPITPTTSATGSAGNRGPQAAPATPRTAPPRPDASTKNGTGDAACGNTGRTSSPSEQATGVGPITVGKTTGDGPWRLPLIGNHLLIGGVTGSGKGSVLWSIIGALAPHVHAGRVRLLVADPKGGMELGPGQPLFHRFAYQSETINAMLADAVEIMTARAQRLRGVTRTHTPTVREPQLVVIVDELAALTAFTDRKLRTEIEHSLGLLLSQGRAVGISVVAAVQDPSKDVVPLRQFFPLRLGLRMAEPTQTTMILGPGAVEAGARCHQLPAHLPGIGYIAADGAAAPVLVRAFHYQDEHIAHLVRHYRAPRTRGAQSGAGARAATDDGVADPDARGKANGDNGGAVPK